MSRFSYSGILLAVVALVSAPVFAQNGAPNRVSTNVSSSARVQHVIVRASGDATEVEIQTSGAPVAPNTQVITGPDRIVVDFPGALPAAELHALTVNRGALKGVRSGLFFSNPPITRIVLDLTEPQSYQISTAQNVTVVKLNSAKLNSAQPHPSPNPAKLDREKSVSVTPEPAQLSSGTISSGKINPVTIGAPKLGSVTATIVRTPVAPVPHTAKLQNATLVATNAGSANAGSTNIGSTNVAPANVAVATVSAAVPPAPAPQIPDVAAVLPPMPFVNVTMVEGMLRIRSEKATLAQVLFEVQRQTHAEIAIPAGAEREQVIADLGPAPARDVLGALLNGTPYNFIFVGNELSLERVILTLRDPNNF